MPVSGASIPIGLGVTLFKLTAANMQSTTDQIFSKLYSGSSWFPTAVIARWRSGTGTLAVGGIYDAAGKTGNIIAAAATAWGTLANGIIVPLVTPLQTIILTATPILSLSTGSAAACTADFYILGVDIS